jgi:hypothetical protein
MSGAPQVVPTETGNVIAIVDCRRVQGRSGCETTIRGVLVTPGGKVLLSPRIQNVSNCALGPWDEKMFFAFAKAALSE